MHQAYTSLHSTNLILKYFSVVNSQSNCNNITEACIVQSGYQCGIQFSPVLNSPYAINAVKFGAYPWEGIVMRNDAEDLYTFYSTGALISDRFFITIASKMQRFA